MRRLKYKILSHTADLRLELYGKTLEELFENAADALADILVKNASRKVGGGLKEEMKVTSAESNTLLVDFLNEILTKSHINKKIYKVSDIKIQISNKENIAEAELVGFPVIEFDEDVKAATYHGINLRQTMNSKRQKIWKTSLVLDI